MSPAEINAANAQYIDNRIRQAGYYRHLTACAQGMGFPGITDALSALAALQAATPVAYVRADALEALKAAPDGIGASLFTKPLAGRVGICLAPVGCDMRAARAPAKTAETRMDASSEALLKSEIRRLGKEILGVDIAFDGDLMSFGLAVAKFVARERAEKGGAQ